MVMQPSDSEQADERVIYDDRPHLVFIVTQSWRWIVFGILLWGLLIWLDGVQPGYGLVYMGWGVLVLVVLRLIFAAVDRIVRVHRLTNRRMVSRFGILSTVRSEMMLERVQHLVVVRTLVERLFGIGSVGVSSAGTGNIEIIWRGVEKPERVREMIQAAAKAASGSESSTGKPAASKKMAVIGLVGGIGSGKSTVARAFADLGCVVSDSDKSGAEALKRPEVIKTLVSWWGEDVLDDSGAVDKKQIARKVFNDHEERSKLEGLVHPLIHEDRKQLIQKARSSGEFRAVIVDAPLLFEAGVESECDAVVFVQTPKRMRLQRVLEGRGWDESELDRRENAQLALEHKRERADYVVANGGSVSELPAQVSQILDEIERNLSGG